MEALQHKKAVSEGQYLDSIHISSPPELIRNLRRKYLPIRNYANQDESRSRRQTRPTLLSVMVSTISCDAADS